MHMCSIYVFGHCFGVNEVKGNTDTFSCLSNETSPSITRNKNQLTTTSQPITELEVKSHEPLREFQGDDQKTNIKVPGALKGLIFISVAEERRDFSRMKQVSVFWLLCKCDCFIYYMFH